MSETTREQLADYAHEAWSGWMRYLFTKSTRNADGTVTIPAWAVERWERQVATPYAQLPDGEKASDRTEADRMLAIVTGGLSWVYNARLADLRAARAAGELAAHVFRKGWQHERWDMRVIVLGAPQPTATWDVTRLLEAGIVGVYSVRRGRDGQEQGDCATEARERPDADGARD